MSQTEQYTDRQNGSERSHLFHKQLESITAEDQFFSGRGYQQSDQIKDE